MTHANFNACDSIQQMGKQLLHPQGRGSTLRNPAIQVPPAQLLLLLSLFVAIWLSSAGSSNGRNNMPPARWWALEDWDEWAMQPVQDWPVAEPFLIGSFYRVRVPPLT